MYVRLVMSVVLFSVRVALGMPVSNMTVVSARAHGFYTVPYSYEFFLQGDVLRTVSTRQKKECLTEQIDNVECTCTFKLMLFLETTLPTHQNGQPLAKP